MLVVINVCRKLHWPQTPQTHTFSESLRVTRVTKVLFAFSLSLKDSSAICGQPPGDHPRTLGSRRRTLS